MTLQVQISEKNKSEIMSAIRLLRGVREVSESRKISKSKKVCESQKSLKLQKSCKSKEEKLPIETKADYKAWKKARKELEMGESISHEELKRKYGL